MTQVGKIIPIFHRKHKCKEKVEMFLKFDIGMIFNKQ